MNRTQEIYNRDGSKAPPDPYEGTYSFPDWSDWRLEQRLADVMETSQLPHNEPRRSDIARETAHLVFELTYRSNQHE